MKQLPLLQGKALLIELPEGATNLQLLTVHQGSKSFPSLKYDRPNLVRGFIDLPPGNWRIIGMLSEVTEEQLTDVIDVLVSSESGKNLYPNLTGGPWKVSRVESLESAIEAENWYFENPVKIHTWASENADDYRKQWETAQSRVLGRSRCLLLGRESN